MRATCASAMHGEERLASIERVEGHWNRRCPFRCNVRYGTKEDGWMGIVPDFDKAYERAW